MMKAMVAALCLAALCGAADAEDFPRQPVQIIVPNAAGGPSDLVARKLASHLSSKWGQAVTVVNRPGGNGMVGTAALARAKPDGHTLMLGVPSLTTLKVLLKNPTVDTERDITPISQILEVPYVVTVHPSLPIKTLQELVQYAKARPGSLNYAGVAGGQILAFELLMKKAGIDLLRIPYAGAAPSLPAIVKGEVQVGFNTISTVNSLLADDSLRALAVTSTTRVATLPNVPTVQEAGIEGYSVGFWFGLVGPAQVPAATQERIAQEVATFVKLPETIQDFNHLGYLPVGSSPRQFSQLIKSEIATWAEVAKYANVSAE